MATQELKQLVVGNVPQHLIDWKGLRAWQSGAQEKKDKDGASEAAPAVAQTPSIGEFERLLYQVSPELKNKVHFNESDLLCLGVSKDLTIAFYDAPKKTSKHDQKKGKAENDNKDKKEEKVEKEIKSDNNVANNAQVMIPKLISKSGRSDNESGDETNTLSMSVNAQFSCLLIGTACCLNGINITTTNNNNNQSNDDMILDLIFNNILKYVGKMKSKEEMKSCKDEIKCLWSLIVQLLKWKNENDQTWVIGLSMMLCVSSENFSKLSFVKEYISRKTEIKNKTAKDDAVTTGGQESNASPKEKEQEINEQCMFLSGSVCCCLSATMSIVCFVLFYFCNFFCLCSN